jgi:RNA polymerase sigma factor (sigma-70 family)
MAEPVAFKSTIWTLVEQAKKDPKALARVLEAYRPPILNYIAAKGHGEDSEDLAQLVLMRVSRPGFLESVARSKGKFRTLLLTVANRVMIDHARVQKAKIRYPGRQPLSIDHIRDDDRGIEPAAKEEDDPEFDRLWVQNLVRLALVRYQKLCDAKGSDYYALFRDHVLAKRSQMQVAEEHGRTVQDVKNAVHAARKKLREFIEERIRDYSLSGAGEEVAYLARFIQLSPRGS